LTGRLLSSPIEALSAFIRLGASEPFFKVFCKSRHGVDGSDAGNRHTSIRSYRDCGICQRNDDRSVALEVEQV
jgi:hypothetical protein